MTQTQTSDKPSLVDVFVEGPYVFQIESIRRNKEDNGDVVRVILPTTKNPFYEDQPFFVNIFNLNDIFKLVSKNQHGRKVTNWFKLLTNLGLTVPEDAPLSKINKEGLIGMKGYGYVSISQADPAFLRLTVNDLKPMPPKHREFIEENQARQEDVYKG